MNLNKYILRAYGMARKRGFFPKCPDCGTPGNGSDYTNELLEESNWTYNGDCDFCNGSGIDQNIPISKLIMDVIEEVAEARKAYRLGDLIAYRKSKIYDCAMHTQKKYFERFEKNTFESELADITIVILSVCGYHGIELEDQDFKVCGTVDQALVCICFYLGELEYSYVNWKQNKLSKITKALNYVYSLILKLCKQEKIDIEKHIELKLKYNELRED